MNAIEKDVETLVTKELEAANKTYDPHFHSANEGYAIILEEWEEMDAKMTCANSTLSLLWDGVKCAPTEKTVEYAPQWAKQAYDEVSRGIVEAIQTAAMLKKFIDSAPHWSGKE